MTSLCLLPPTHHPSRHVQFGQCCLVTAHHEATCCVVQNHSRVAPTSLEPADKEHRKKLAVIYLRLFCDSDILFWIQPSGKLLSSGSRSHCGVDKAELFFSLPLPCFISLHLTLCLSQPVFLQPLSPFCQTVERETDSISSHHSDCN